MTTRVRLHTMARPILAWVALMVPATAATQTTCDGGGNYRIRLTPSAIDYGVVSSADLDAGQIVMGSMRIRIRPRGGANGSWNLCLQADSGQFGPGGKPVGDVEWQLAGSPGWQPALTGGQLVVQGNGNQTVDVLFRILLDWNELPGIYVAPVTFLVARQ